jgi:serine/threonine protein kinase
MDTTAGRAGADTAMRDPLVGRTIDHRYVVESRLARGGMATVYEALDLRLDRIVALKVMHPGLADDEAFVSRFQREAKSAARLSHPHVVSVFDQGADDGLVYLAMEFVPGRTVRDVLRSYGKLSAEQALTIIDPVLQALDAAHKAGFVHRDIKPENVLLGNDGTVKVADFGLARAISTTNSTATQGVLIGTVAYLSPEQVERGIADARSDVYGAGILLYEMVTGAVPYAGETPLAVAYQHVNAAVPAPSSIRPGLPKQLDALVNRATRRDPDERYSSAADFLDAVRATRRELPSPRPLTVDVTDGARTLVVQLPTTEFRPAANSTSSTDKFAAAANSPKGPQSPKPPKPRRRRPTGLIVLAAIVMLVLIVGGFAWWFGAGRSVAIPGIIGQSVSTATSKLDAASLTLEVQGQQFSETVKPGTIISSNPKPGAEVKVGSTVQVVVSKGQERYEVPALIGQPLADAGTMLSDASLSLGSISKVYDEKVAAGSVIATDPKATVALRKGTAVNLVVSRGPKSRVIPKLRNQTQVKALAELSSLGLKGSVSSQAYDDNVPSGSVLSSNPGVGQQVARGSTVTLVVSQGPAPVTMPTVKGEGTDTAVAQLTALGLKVRTNNLLGIPTLNIVYSQDPTGATLLHRGDTVTLGIV